jgi:predicted ArsR family transcriptional regulator
VDEAAGTAQLMYAGPPVPKRASTGDQLLAAVQSLKQQTGDNDAATVQALARKLGWSDATVLRHVDQLAVGGLLAVREAKTTPGRGRASNVYDVVDNGGA